MKEGRFPLVEIVQRHCDTCDPIGGRKRNPTRMDRLSDDEKQGEPRESRMYGTQAPFCTSSKRGDVEAGQ